jgi:hypothetical protein
MHDKQRVFGLVCQRFSVGMDIIQRGDEAKVNYFIGRNPLSSL